MHSSSHGRTVDRHPAHLLTHARTPPPAPRDPEPLALSAAEIRRIVLDLIG